MNTFKQLFQSSLLFACLVLAYSVKFEVPSSSTSQQQYGISSARVATNHTKSMTEHIAVQKWRAVDRVIQKMTANLYKSVLPTIMQVNENLNLTSSCSRSIMKVLTGLKQMKLWAFRMLDSSGKLPIGLISGNINSLGDYDLCVETTVPGDFRGQYCTLDVSPPLPERRRFVPTYSEVPEFVNFTKPDLLVMEFLRRGNFYYRFNIRSSVCVPSTCSRQEIHSVATKVAQMAGIDFDILIPNCEVLQDKIDLDASQLAIILIIGMILLTGTTATVTDVFLKLRIGEAYRDQISLPLKYLLCFSFYTNTLRLLKPDTNPDSFKIFHGIKVITILWVILNHTYYYYNFQASAALLNAMQAGNDIAFQFIINGFFSVETFFFISAVLVAYGVMKMKQKKLNIGFYIFRRIWRLTPPFMFVIALVFLLPLIGSGPVWKETVLDGLTDKCRTNWWTNLIFINNFIESKNMCLQWLWYIPVDTHLYFLSLLVLIPLKSHPRLAFVINGGLLLCGTAISAAFHVYYQLTPTGIFQYSHPDDINYYADRGYFRTYLHVSTFCVGLTVGYIIATRPKLHIPLAANIAGWVVSVLMPLILVYGVYEWNKGYIPGMAASVLYASTRSFLWSLALAWVTIACMTGNGGIVNSILSWPTFVPLGRLVYMTYLIHPIIHFVYIGSTRTLIRAEHRTMVYIYLSNVLMAFMCAYGLTLLFESPFMALEKVMFETRAPSKQNKSEKREFHETSSEPDKGKNHGDILQLTSFTENNGVYAIRFKPVETINN